MTSNSKSRMTKYQVRSALQPTIAPLAAAVTGALAASSLQAATITVDTLQDGLEDDQCSLRSALYASSNNGAANGCTAGQDGLDTIVFADGLQGTIDLVPTESGLYYDGSTLPIGESVVIDGGGDIVVNGSGSAPVFYAKYGGAFSAEEVTIDGLTIQNGGGDIGGGILSKVRRLDLNNSVVSANTANEAGGGLWHEFAGAGASQVYIRDSGVIDNDATSSDSAGGGIYIAGNVQTLQLVRSTISGNSALGSGGGIEWRARSGIFSNYFSVFTENEARAGRGGAINAVNPGGGVGTALIARDSDFYLNSAATDGGAIAVTHNGNGRVNLQGNDFVVNSAAGAGGAFWSGRATDGTGTPVNPDSRIELAANDSVRNETRFYANSAAASGGAVYININADTPIIMDKALFERNTSIGGDGGGVSLITGSAGLQLSNVSFIDNSTESAGSEGGGLRTELMDGGDLQASQISFVQNSSAGDGGGMTAYLAGGQTEVEYSDFIGNTAEGGYGGGLNISGTPGQINMGRLILRGNYAASGGGGVDVFTPGAEGEIFEIKYSELSNNSTAGDGGAINVVAGTGTEMIIENSTLSSNAAENGGAIRAGDSFFNAMSLDVKYSTVFNNEATTLGGGLLTSLEGDCDIRNSIFDINLAGPDDLTQDVITLEDDGQDCEVVRSLMAGTDSEFINGAGNLLAQASQLLPLADNGGSGGFTHALPESSPAIDAGGSADEFTPSNDQRGEGFSREVGDGVDMGAFEFGTIVDQIFEDRFESP